MENNLQKNILKPNGKSFLFFESFLPILLFIIVNIFGLIFSWGGMGWKIAGGLLILFVIFLGIWNYIRLNKEEYEFFDEKIIIRRGSLISHNSTEIYFNKITQVTLRLGFWQNIFFHTGDVIISTGAMGKIALRDIDFPSEIFEKIQEGMRNNGFHLQKNALVQETTPHMLAIFTEILSRISSFAVAGLYILMTFRTSSDSEISEIMTFLQKYSLYFYMATIAFVLAIVIYLILQTLDLRRRKYQVFTDAIVYHEGFLTKYFSLLPMEKVADTENTQGFFAKIFGLHDIIISSEGSSSRVVFKNMINGELMLKNITFLKSKITMTTPKMFVETSEEDVVDYKNTIDSPFEYNQDFIKKYKPHIARSLIGVIFSLILALIVSVVILKVYDSDIFIAIFIIATMGIGHIRQIIAAFSTSFSIGESTIESRFSFLSNYHNVFSVDKITRVDFSKNPIDWIFNTTTITFSSIGSAKRIAFRYVKISDDDKKGILEKVGIYQEMNTEKIPVDFSFIRFAQANIFSVILLPLFLLAFIWSKISYSSRFYENIFAKKYIKSRFGVIFQNESYVLLENIKSLKMTKYIGTNTGGLVLSVSGNSSLSSSTKDESQQSGTIALSSNLVINYIENIFEFGNYLDEKLGKQSISSDIIASSHREVKNFLVSAIIFLVIIILLAIIFLSTSVLIWLLIPLIAIALIIDIFYIWYIKTHKYELQDARVVLCEGIFYKTRESILYKKINFIEKSQGFVEKICKNGTIQVFTLGSDKMDLQMTAVSDFEKIYAILKEKVKK